MKKAKRKKNRQRESNGDENSLIYMYNNTLYYFDKEKDKSYSIYKFDN